MSSSNGAIPQDVAVPLAIVGIVVVSVALLVGLYFAGVYFWRRFGRRKPKDASAPVAGTTASTQAGHTTGAPYEDAHHPTDLVSAPNPVNLDEYLGPVVSDRRGDGEWAQTGGVYGQQGHYDDGGGLAEPGWGDGEHPGQTEFVDDARYADGGWVAGAEHGDAHVINVHDPRYRDDPRRDYGGEAAHYAAHGDYEEGADFRDAGPHGDYRDDAPDAGYGEQPPHGDYREEGEWAAQHEDAAPGDREAQHRAEVYPDRDHWAAAHTSPSASAAAQRERESLEQERREQQRYDQQQQRQGQAEQRRFDRDRLEQQRRLEEERLEQQRLEYEELELQQRLDRERFEFEQRQRLERERFERAQRARASPSPEQHRGYGAPAVSDTPDQHVGAQAFEALAVATGPRHGTTATAAAARKSGARGEDSRYSSRKAAGGARSTVSGAAASLTEPTMTLAMRPPPSAAARGQPEGLPTTPTDRSARSAHVSDNSDTSARRGMIAALEERARASAAAAAAAVAMARAAAHAAALPALPPLPTIKEAAPSAAAPAPPEAPVAASPRRAPRRSPFDPPRAFLDSSSALPLNPVAAALAASPATEPPTANAAPRQPASDAAVARHKQQPERRVSGGRQPARRKSAARDDAWRSPMRPVATDETNASPASAYAVAGEPASRTVTEDTALRASDSSGARRRAKPNLRLPQYIHPPDTPVTAAGAEPPARLGEVSPPTAPVPAAPTQCEEGAGEHRPGSAPSGLADWQPAAAAYAGSASTRAIKRGAGDARPKEPPLQQRQQRQRASDRGERPQPPVEWRDPAAAYRRLPPPEPPAGVPESPGREEEEYVDVAGGDGGDWGEAAVSGLRAPAAALSPPTGARRGAGGTVQVFRLPAPAAAPPPAASDAAAWPLPPPPLPPAPAPSALPVPWPRPPPGYMAGSSAATAAAAFPPPAALPSLPWASPQLPAPAQPAFAGPYAAPPPPPLSPPPPHAAMLPYSPGHAYAPAAGAAYPFSAAMAGGGGSAAAVLLSRTASSASSSRVLYAPPGPMLPVSYAASGSPVRGGGAQPAFVSYPTSPHPPLTAAQPLSGRNRSPAEGATFPRPGGSPSLGHASATSSGGGLLTLKPMQGVPPPPPVRRHGGSRHAGR